MHRWNKKIIKKKILGKEKDCLKNEDAIQGTTQGTSLTQEESATQQVEQPSVLDCKGSGHSCVT